MFLYLKSKIFIPSFYYFEEISRFLVNFGQPVYKETKTSKCLMED